LFISEKLRTRGYVNRGMGEIVRVPTGFKGCVGRSTWFRYAEFRFVAREYLFIQRIYSSPYSKKF